MHFYSSFALIKKLTFLVLCVNLYIKHKKVCCVIHANILSIYLGRTVKKDHFPQILFRERNSGIFLYSYKGEVVFSSYTCGVYTVIYA